MHTIKLKISEKVYDKLLWLLSKFSKDEIEILSNENSFAETKNYLEKELDDIDSGKATFHTLEEVDNKIESSIRANENRI
ncbi:MAG: tRNA pseudouridine synthase A [Bacteroidota bacterium]|nr:tRNA pseudouridine synthase A [Bacteroidota bacterium]